MADGGRGDVFPFPQGIKPSLAVTILLVVAVLAVLFTSVYTVDETEEAVVLRLGKYEKTGGSGLHFKFPLGIDKAFKVPTKVVQTLQFGYRTARPGITTVFSPKDYTSESVILTGDLNIVNVTWVVQYRIRDPRAWLFNVEEDTRIKTIRDISQSVVNQLVGDRAITEVISEGREEIENQSRLLIGQIASSYQLGIQISSVKLQKSIAPEGPVQDAFEDVNKAIQDMNRLINEGKEAYQAEIPKASGQAKQLLEVAQGYATERINEAKGNTARFEAVLQEYKRNPSVTRSRLYYEMVTQVLEKNGEGTELLDRNLENFIPLKNLGGPR